MGKIGDWASRRRGQRPAASSVDAAQPVQVVVQGAPHARPNPAPVILDRSGAQPRPYVAMIQPALQYPQLAVPQYTHGSTCAVVRALANEPYERFLQTVPDLVTTNLAKVDAMKLAGRPVDADMAKWTDTARRRYGATDRDSPITFEDHVRQAYGIDVSAIRAESKK